MSEDQDLFPEERGDWLESSPHWDGLSKILDRMPGGWFRSIDCGPGWFPIIVELDQAIAEIAPNYIVYQVKEKFGGLRYYWGLADQDRTVTIDLTGGDGSHARVEMNAPTADDTWSRINALVDEAEARLWKICEVTGEPGVLMCTSGHWYRTLDPITADDRYVTIVRPRSWRPGPEATTDELRSIVDHQNEMLGHYMGVMQRLFDAYRAAQTSSASAE